MKKINMKILTTTVLVCLLPIIFGLMFYNKLPERIAIHWGIDNNPNGYFSKPGFVFGMPVIMLVLQAVCCIVNDLSDKNEEANKKAITVYKWIIPIITMILYSVTVAIALGKNLDVRKIVMIILGVLFIVIGNYMPKINNDYYLNSKKFWIKNKDEKLTGKIVKISAYSLIIFGLLSILSILFSEIASITVVIVMILFLFIISIYAYIKGKK